MHYHCFFFFPLHNLKLFVISFSFDNRKGRIILLGHVMHSLGRCGNLSSLLPYYIIGFCGSLYQFVMYTTFSSFNLIFYLLNVGFKGKYYLWGAFRSVPRMPGNGKRTLGNSAIESCVPIPASDDVPRSTCDEDQEANSLKRPRSPVSSHDSDNDELKLFPLEVEDMAVKARVRGRGGLDLELGLGRPVGEDGEALLCCKPRSGRTTDSLLALDNARSITLL